MNVYDTDSDSSAYISESDLYHEDVPYEQTNLRLNTLKKQISAPDIDYADPIKTNSNNKIS